ncbi:hypothetical protein BgiBS90_006356 [Biomphalaria glabrata]|nr:hypothetical protein BgiBS90_006356 [Biomphalaria glabrata]
MATSGVDCFSKTILKLNHLIGDDLVLYLLETAGSKGLTTTELTGMIWSGLKQMIVDPQNVIKQRISTILDVLEEQEVITQYRRRFCLDGEQVLKLTVDTLVESSTILFLIGTSERGLTIHQISREVWNVWNSVLKGKKNQVFAKAIDKVNELAQDTLIFKERSHFFLL